MGWQIFLHSIRQVTGNLPAALRISGALFLVQLVVSTALGVSLGGDQAALEARMQAGNFPFLGFILVIVVAMLTGIWIAVAWHRYVLKLETPTSFIPAFHSDRMLSYFGNSLLLGVIAIPVALVTSLIAGLIYSGLLGGGMPGPVAGIILSIIIFLPVVVVVYRLSVILPGAALGEKVRLGDAWRRTAGSSGAIILLAVVSILAAIVIDLPLMVLGSVPLLGFAWGAATAWLKMMVGISILTTLYGHFVEGRALV